MPCLTLSRFFPMHDTTPKLITTVAQLRAEIGEARREGKTVGLAPTMAALHEGHLSLVRAAKAECGLAVASIFVNPSQFGPNEDFAQYPRTLDADLTLLAGCGADLVFAPAPTRSIEPVTPHGSRSARSPNRWKAAFGQTIFAAWPRSS